MRPGGRVIHDIPAVSLFFFCSSNGMLLKQAVLAGENHLPPDQALPQWKKPINFCGMCSGCPTNK
jgi:hypothetical protein